MFKQGLDLVMQPKVEQKLVTSLYNSLIASMDEDTIAQYVEQDTEERCAICDTLTTYWVEKRTGRGKGEKEVRCLECQKYIGGEIFDKILKPRFESEEDDDGGDRDED